MIKKESKPLNIIGIIGLGIFLSIYSKSELVREIEWRFYIINLTLIT